MMFGQLWDKGVVRLADVPRAILNKIMRDRFREGRPVYKHEPNRFNRKARRSRKHVLRARLAWIAKHIREDVRDIKRAEALAEYKAKGPEYPKMYPARKVIDEKTGAVQYQRA